MILINIYVKLHGDNIRLKRNNVRCDEVDDTVETSFAPPTFSIVKRFKNLGSLHPLN